MDNLSGCLADVFGLLKQTQPAAPIETDVVWKGPYYIPRRRVWGATHFVLYRGTLYAALFIGSGHYGLSWKVESNECKFEGSRASVDAYGTKDGRELELLSADDGFSLRN
jgi:hypothetical protein